MSSVRGGASPNNARKTKGEKRVCVPSPYQRDKKRNKDNEDLSGETNASPETGARRGRVQEDPKKGCVQVLGLQGQKGIQVGLFSLQSPSLTLTAPSVRLAYLSPFLPPRQASQGPPRDTQEPLLMFMFFFIFVIHERQMCVCVCVQSLHNSHSKL